MNIVYLMLEGLVFTLLTLSIARAPKFCEFFDEIPKKYIVNNKFSNFILLKPKYPTMKCLFALFLSQLFCFVLICILCLLYLLGVQGLAFLNNNIFLKYYLIYLAICFVPTNLIDAIITNKYLFGNKKNKFN